MSLDTTQLKTIYAFAMGYGTEVLPGENPYQLVQSTGNSGWSMGVIQYDFGQRGLDGVLVDFVNNWAASVNRSGLSVSRDAAIAILNSKGTSIQNFSSADHKLINEWAAANSNVFYQNFERLVVEENVPKVATAINNDRFSALPEADQMRIVMMLSKAINQGGNGGFLDAQAILNGLSDSKYNADGFAEAIRLATNTTYQLDTNSDLRKGIAQADLVGKTLAVVSDTPGLNNLLSEAYNTTSFDIGTVSKSGGLAFLSTLLQNAKDPSRATEFSRFLGNFSNPSDKGAYFNNGNTVIGITSDGALFLVDSKTLSGSYSKLGLWEPLNNGVSKFGNITIIQRNKNGKPAFVIAGLGGEEAGLLITEGTITSLSKPESQAALLAAALDGLNGDIFALDRNEAANLVNGMMTPVMVASLGDSIPVDASQLAINADLAALRDAILNDPNIQIAANGDVSTITTQGTIYAVTSDGQTLLALTDNGVLTGYDFLTGRDAGKTVSWTVEGTLSDTQLAALGSTMATALAPGLETGAITAIPLEGFNGTITATLTRKGTGEILSSVQITTLRDNDGTPVGTLRIETRTESGALVTTETRQYTSGPQAVTLTTITSNNLQGQTVQAQFVNGQFNGITQFNGVAISDGLQKLFAGTLSENGIDGALTTQDIARLGQELGSEATSRDTALRAALEAMTGEAVAGTDYYGNPTLISQTEATLKTVGNSIGTLIDALSLVNAIQSGKPLPIIASGLRLAAGIDYLDGTRDLPLLGAASSAASSVLSLYGLVNALEQGNGIAAITSAAYVVKGVADTAAFLQTSGLIQEVPAALQGAGQLLGKALPYLNVINSIAQGDMTGAAVAVVDIILINAGVYTIPIIGWAYAIYSLIDGLFGGGEEIPDPWGSGTFVWNGTGITYQSAGETGGNEAVANVMDNVLATLNSLIERERQQNPGSQLGIIPQRMPSMGYDMSGYRYTDIDPLTGAEKNPALRFDTSGNPYNAEPGSPESFQSIIEGMVYSALGRQAIAPLWEVLTARAQTDAGDPKAGLTEEERAGRDGRLAPPITGTTQTFRPVMLDLDGDGIETLGKAASGVAFNVDDSGFMKQTGWATGGDAFLTLDRDYNGETNTGREMFSNSVIDISRRGLAGMAWVDSNYDGKLTAADPVWNDLKVWLDDGDGVDEAGEKLTLAGLGITELNYSMGTFTQNGQVKQLASPDLDADKDGTRVTIVPEGILVQSNDYNGETNLGKEMFSSSVVDISRRGLATNDTLYARAA